MDRMRMVRNGEGGRSEDWPSKALHDVGPQREGGVDRRRLLALADFIESLPLHDPTRPLSGPCSALEFVDGRRPVHAYSLRAGGAGYGYALYDSADRQTSKLTVAMTGYGLMAWAWGADRGMANVADDAHVNALQAVLSAQPVFDRELADLAVYDLTTGHVADALRYWVEHECEPGVAWFNAGGPRAAPPPAPKPEAPAPLLRAAGTQTARERRKALMLADDWEGLRRLCRERIDALDGERKEWARYLAAAEAYIGEGE